ncbi:SAM-dependent methyltransferase [Actinoplanes sp. NPDC051861]|uniref:SAM-dependent methyltransferase n=1 Tax=Actinoplanes sp. NPDC051861 TaxID=3155170 RepID=UPI00341F6324
MTDTATLNTDLPHSARVWGYLLGGKDNFAADRVAAEALLKACPALVTASREARQFLSRAVRHLAEVGVRQFVDIGAGLPMAVTVHGVAQAVAPQARIVYVDNDPLVMVHARALLTGTGQGSVDYVEADVRDPGAVLAALHTTAVDLSAPAGLLLSAILPELPDGQAHDVVGKLVAALAPGSYVVLSHYTADPVTEPVRAMIADAAEAHQLPLRLRTRAEVARFLEGLELVDPGVVSTAHWRVAAKDRTADESAAMCWAAVGRLP